MTKTYGSFDNFLTTFTPDRQAQFCSTPVARERCLTGTAPTIAEIRKCYGERSASMWILPQLDNLAMFCGCKDKLSPMQLIELGTIITSKYYYLKVTELMLFFFNFKSGKYGKFYGSVDPMVITTALEEFAQERSYKLEAILQQKAQREAEEERKHCVSWQEYQDVFVNHTKTHQETFQTSSVDN